MNAQSHPAQEASAQVQASQEASPGGSTLVLGDLLYTNPEKAPVLEADWVALVRSIAAGDALALRALYERTHPIVFMLALRIVKTRQIAEDVTVEVFHDVWRRAATYDSAGGTVVGWIMYQARSRATERLDGAGTHSVRERWR